MKMFFDAWEKMISNWKLLLGSIITDAVYMVSFAWLITYTFTNIVGYTQQLYDIMGASALTNTTEMQSFIQEKTPQFMNAYSNMVYYVCIFIAGALLLWIVLQGFAWYLAHRMNGRKIDTKQYLKHYIVISIAAAVTGIIGFYLISLLGSASLQGLIPPTFVSYLTLAWLGLLLYFIFFAYAHLSMVSQFKEYFALLAKKWKRSLVAYVFTLIFLGASNWVLVQLYSSYEVFMYLFLLLIALPVYTYNRLLMISSVKEEMTAKVARKKR